MNGNNQYHRADDIVEQIHQVLGKHPGYRALHADGRLYLGSYQAYEVGHQYSRAAHWSGEKIPVVVRFSKGGGDPYAHFNNTVGMATRFYLPSGAVTALVMLSQKLFIARSVEQFLDLLKAGLPLQQGGPPNQEGLKRFLKGNPNSAAVFQLRASTPGPVSFAQTSFHAVHAFRFLNHDDQLTHARLHWVPLAGEQSQPLEELSALPIDALFTELNQRLARQSAEFELVMELAEPGDPLEDATALWPADRARVPVGRLCLTQPVDEELFGSDPLLFDPTQLTDGIEATNDPILQVRRGVYEVSAAFRTGGCPMFLHQERKSS